VTLANNVVFGNQGGGLRVADDSDVVVANSVLRGNGGYQIAAPDGLPLTIFSNVEGGFPGEGNIDEDAMFVDPTNGDFHLRWGSPCVDAGSNDAPAVPALDFEGDDRVIDGDLDSIGVVDIGADEADPPTAALFGSVNAAAGFVSDVLRVNGAVGDAHRVLDVEADGPISFFMGLPPAGGSGGYVVHANAGRPSVDTLAVLPAGVGLVGFPLLLPAGADPIAVFNNLGKTHAVGESEYFDGTPLPPPPPAPATFLELPSGDPANLPPGTTLTLQGVIRDPATTATKPGSATNGLVVRIL
jgi:hypothetical protein